MRITLSKSDNVILSVPDVTAPAQTACSNENMTSTVLHITMSDINVQPVNLLKNIDLPQRKKPRNRCNYGSGALRYLSARYYIIPPSGIAGTAGVGSGMSTIPHSVVRNMPATDAAFSRATRLTLVGSMTPASNMFTYSSVRAL